jgi:hypothetical protein
LKFNIYDYFGLDINDVTDDKPFKGGDLYASYPPFVAWYCLQHYSGFGGKHKPFVTSVELEFDFNGSL